MADILGTAATATLLRRAAKKAAARQAVLSSVHIGQEGLTYRYVLPNSWQQGSDRQGLDALRALTQELKPLLIEMTGSVVIRRLANVPALHTVGISAQPEEIKD
jgi:hypothetical protein